LALGAFVPSAIPRVIVIMPITLSLARTMGMIPGSRGHTGLLMTAAMMTLVPTYTFLTANLPTIVEMGAIEILYDQHISYGAYFIQNAPINVVRFGVLLTMLLAFGRGTKSTSEPLTDTGDSPHLTTEQQRLLYVLIFAIGL